MPFARVKGKGLSGSAAPRRQHGMSRWRLPRQTKSETAVVTFLSSLKSPQGLPFSGGFAWDGSQILSDVDDAKERRHYRMAVGL